uniref:Uncharacterized protein n=1 Tax=Ovis aries TaxID=9940 RepID=A0AC11E7D7_SHEEP
MSLEDPFFVVRGEVQKAVNTARGLYQRWCELLQESAVVGREELDWTTNELRNGLRSIEWDLEDLEETIDILGANPGKFKLPAGDLQERKVFVQRMRESVQEMKDHMVSPAAVAFMERNNREMLTGKPATLKSSSVLLDASVVSTTSCYIEEQQATQQVRAGGWQPQAGGDCGQLRAPCQPRFPPLHPAADPGPAGSTAGNGVWEHLSSETHVRPSWGGAGRAGHYAGRLCSGDGPHPVPDGWGP